MLDTMLGAARRATPTANIAADRDLVFWLTLAYAQLGAPAKARAILEDRLSRLDETGRRRDHSDIERMRGLVALAEGKTDSAIVHFCNGDNEADGLPTYFCGVCTPLFVGPAFYRGGQPDSARKYLTQYDEMSGTWRSGIDRYFLAPALYRLGELYEGAHDTKRAAEYYGRFVELWKNADADLQPRVAEARSRIDHLNRAKQ